MDLHKALPDNLILGGKGQALQKEALFCLPLSSSSSCFSLPSSGLFPLSVQQAQALGQTLWLHGSSHPCLFLIRTHTPPL